MGPLTEKTMKLDLIKRVLKGAVLATPILTGSYSVPASAQAVPSCPCVVNAICCQCADGSLKTVDLSTGIAPWRVTGPGGGPSQLVVGGSNSAWTASAPSAQWVVPPGAPQVAGNYVYTLQYNIPSCVIPASVVMTVQFAADDSATIAGTGFTASGFGTTGTLPTVVLPATFTTPGLHTLTVNLNNVVGATGLLVKATLTTRCPLQQPTGGTATTTGDAQPAGEVQH
jgi:hypothetical protein